MPQATVHPEIGAVIPNFVITNPTGEESTIEAQSAGRRAIIHFMRSASCPVCINHVRAIGRLLDEGGLGDVRLIAVAPGDESEAALAAQRLGVERALVWASGSGHAQAGLGTFLTLQHSGTFVLDADSRIVSATVSAIPTASYSRKAVLEALSRV